MIKAYKFWYFNHDGKMQHEFFSSEEIGFDWCDRYGVEYFDHIEKEIPKENIWI